MELWLFINALRF